MNTQAQDGSAGAPNSEASGPTAYSCAKAAANKPKCKSWCGDQRRCVSAFTFHDGLEAAALACERLTANSTGPQRRVAGEDIARAIRAIAAHEVKRTPSTSAEPIDMVLHCPACGLQHIDGPEQYRDGLGRQVGEEWSNPPHRSHLCHGCGHIWRPADVPTNGVEAVKTTGKNDSPITQPSTSAEAVALHEELAAKQHQFVRETLRTSESAALLRCWIEAAEAGDDLDKLVSETKALLAKPINLPPWPRAYSEEEGDAYMHGWFDGNESPPYEAGAHPAPSTTVAAGEAIAELQEGFDGFPWLRAVIVDQHEAARLGEGAKLFAAPPTDPKDDLLRRMAEVLELIQPYLLHYSGSSAGDKMFADIDQLLKEARQ